MQTDLTSVTSLTELASMTEKYNVIKNKKAPETQVPFYFSKIIVS